MVRQTFGILLAGLLIFAAAAVSPAVARAGKSDPILVQLDTLHPTQFNVGLDEVNARLGGIQSELEAGPAEFEKYLRSEVLPVVRGPGGELFLTDGHHFSYALNELGVSHVYVRIIEDYSNLSEKKFWKEMTQNNLAHLQDRGVFRPASELPRQLSELTDDPYRSLAWIVRRAGGYRKMKIPFQEFLWADFFRKRITYDMSTPEARIQTLSRAMRLAGSKEARNISGFNQAEIKPKCIEAIMKAALGIDSGIDGLSGIRK